MWREGDGIEGVEVEMLLLSDPRQVRFVIPYGWESGELDR